MTGTISPFVSSRRKRVAVDRVLLGMRPLDPNLVRAWHRDVARRRRRARQRGRSERRSDRRFPIANTEFSSPAVSGRVLDIHRGGMSIESNAALRPGREYTLTLKIGTYVEALEARVLWCRLLSTERRSNGDVVPVYRAGIRRVRPAQA